MTQQEFKQLAKLVNALKKQAGEIDANGDAYPEYDRRAMFDLLQNAAELHNVLNQLYY